MFTATRWLFRRKGGGSASPTMQISLICWCAAVQVLVNAQGALGGDGGGGGASFGLTTVRSAMVEWSINLGEDVLQLAEGRFGGGAGEAGGGAADRTKAAAEHVLVLCEHSVFLLKVGHSSLLQLHSRCHLSSCRLS